MREKLKSFLKALPYFVVASIITYIWITEGTPETKDLRYESAVLQSISGISWITLLGSLIGGIYFFRKYFDIADKLPKSKKKPTEARLRMKGEGRRHLVKAVACSLVFFASLMGRCLVLKTTGDIKQFLVEVGLLSGLFWYHTIVLRK